MKSRVGALTVTVLLLVGIFIACPQIKAVKLQTPNKWSVTGPINVGRYCHTACLLQDGKVLVAGGRGKAGYLSSAEVYNPQTSTWSVVKSMNATRYSFASALLPDGKVLVMGGYAGRRALYHASAEIYDPITNTWTITGPMNNPRASFTATALPDGRVLVVGGECGKMTLTSAEIYDPKTGTWSVTGSLKTPRAYHSAVVSNNTVIVSGGGKEQAETYDITHGTFTSIGAATVPVALFGGNMLSIHNNYTSTLLKTGQVLIVGDGTLSNKTFSTECELFTPACYK